MNVAVGQEYSLELPPWPEEVDLDTLHTVVQSNGVAMDIELSRDYKTIKIKGNETGTGFIDVRGMTQTNILYTGMIEVRVGEDGTELRVEPEYRRILLCPGESVDIPVFYEPKDAVVKTTIRENPNGDVSVEYHEDRKVLTIHVSEDAVIPKISLFQVAIQLYDKEDQSQLLAEYIQTGFLLETQLKATTLEAALEEAKNRITILSEQEPFGMDDMMYKLCQQLCAVIGDASDEERQAHVEEIGEVEEAVVLFQHAYMEDVRFSAETRGEGIDWTTYDSIGGVLNLLATTGKNIKYILERVDSPANPGTVTLDMKIQLDNGKPFTKFATPILQGFRVPGIDLTKPIRIQYTSEDGETQRITDYYIRGSRVVFWGDSTGKFSFSNVSSNNDSGGSSSGESNQTSTTTDDAKRGKVNSQTGIITGSGDGYSKWISETVNGQTGESWKLQYADGTFAAGTYLRDEQGNLRLDSAGNPIEQPQWELVNGKWYAFDVNGYVKSGLVFDPTLNGWFYLDINSGMKTGWQQINGNWYFFNMTPDGTRGIMYVNRQTPDGYHVNEAGVWVQ